MRNKFKCIQVLQFANCELWSAFEEVGFRFFFYFKTITSNQTRFVFAHSLTPPSTPRLPPPWQWCVLHTQQQAGSRARSFKAEVWEIPEQLLQVETLRPPFAFGHPPRRWQSLFEPDLEHVNRSQSLAAGPCLPAQAEITGKRENGDNIIKNVLFKFSLSNS